MKLLFTESDICKSRMHCVSCRRDANFRSHMLKSHDEWMCPLDIAIDAPDDKYPPSALSAWKTQQEQMKVHQKKMDDAKIALDELSMTLTGDNLVRVEKIRSVFFAQSKTASTCKNSSKQIGEVDQVCCGGTVKKVPAFECSKHIICTDKKCNQCTEYQRK